MTYYQLAQESDIPEIEAIILKAYKPVASALPRPPGAIDNTKRKLTHSFHQNQLYTIYKDKETLVGTFSLAMMEGNTAKLFHFALKPEFQKQGIGSFVVKDIIEMISKNFPHITSILIEVYLIMSNLLRFYKTFGFARVGEKKVRG
ncbi:MAG: GNAT family N-acetyltransferase, partial [Candidatus Hodarchaeales archaeon]